MYWCILDFLGWGIVKARTDSVRTATLITAAAKYSVVVFNLIITMVLARVLSPEEFGVVSVISVFSTFFMMMSDFGLGKGIVQDKTLTREELTGINTINIYVSLFVGFLFLPCSLVLSFVYNNKIFIPLGSVLAFSLFFSSLATVPNALFMKDRRFVLVGIIGLCSAVVGGVTAVVLARAGFGCFALAFQSLATSAINELALYVNAHKEFGIRFVFHPQLSGIKRILSYSAHQFGFDLINYFARNLDNILIGKAMGTTALGYYDKAYKLTTFPVNYLTAVISSSLHPILSEHQDDLEYIYDRYIPIVKFLSLSGVLFAAICCSTSGELITLAFGNQWAASIIPFAFLSISMWFQMTASSCGAIYQSCGKTDLMFRSCLVFVPIQVALIILGVSTASLEACTIFVAASFILKFFIDYWFLITRCFGKSYISFLKAFLPELVLIVVCAVPTLLLNYSGLLECVSLITAFLAKVLLILIAYVIGLKLTGQTKYLTVVVPRHILSYFPWLL